MRTRTRRIAVQIKLFHLDLKAGCFRREYLNRIFNRLASLGYTHILFELEDRVQLDSIAGAWWHESYSREEFSDILRDASSAGLVPVPLIQTLGHLEFLLSRAKYHPLRETPASDCMLCPSLGESRAFLKRLIAEVNELFESPPFIHLGADEARSLGVCPECRRMAGSVGIGGLFGGHINELAKEVISRGSRPVIWADMVLAYPEAVSLLDRNIVLVDWDYNTGDGEPEKVRIWGAGHFTPEQKNEYPEGFLSGPGRHVFAENGSLRPWPFAKYLMEEGFSVWIAPAVTSGGDHYFTPRFMHFPNVAGAVRRLGTEPRPEGLIVTAWALRLTVFETHLAAAAIPAAAESAGNAGWKSLEPVVSSLVFQEEIDGIFRAWEKISVPLISTHSYLGIGKHIYYYGAAEPLDCLVSGWDAEGRLKHEAETLEEKVLGYTEGEKITASLIPHLKSGEETASFLNFAARAMLAKAEELDLALKSYYDKKTDRSAAADLIVKTEELKDEYGRMLSDIYRPASVERFLTIIFDSSRRYLERVANEL